MVCKPGSWPRRGLPDADRPGDSGAGRHAESQPSKHHGPERIVNPVCAVETNTDTPDADGSRKPDPVADSLAPQPALCTVPDSPHGIMVFHDLKHGTRRNCRQASATGSVWADPSATLGSMTTPFDAFAVSAALATIAVWITGTGILWLYVQVNRFGPADPLRWWWNRLVREHIVFLWWWAVPFRWLWRVDVPPPGSRAAVLTIVGLVVFGVTGKLLRDQVDLWNRIRARAG